MNKEAVAALDAVVDGGGTVFEGVVAASEVLNLPVVETLNLALDTGVVDFTFVSRPGNKNAEGTRFVRVVDRGGRRVVNNKLMK